MARKKARSGNNGRGRRRGSGGPAGDGGEGRPGRDAGRDGRPSLHTLLEEIRLRDPESLLRPRAIVDVARNPRSPLHSYFTWDDGEAAEKYREIQASRLIRFEYTTTAGSSREQRTIRFRTYWPTKTEETRSGGYRPTVEIMTDESRRAALLLEALGALNALRTKYGHLQELARVFDELERVRRGRRRRA